LVRSRRLALASSTTSILRKPALFIALLISRSPE
jgi:hypothetical protein